MLRGGWARLRRIPPGKRRSMKLGGGTWRSRSKAHQHQLRGAPQPLRPHDVRRFHQAYQRVLEKDREPLRRCCAWLLRVQLHQDSPHASHDTSDGGPTTQSVERVRSRCGLGSQRAEGGRSGVGPDRAMRWLFIFRATMDRMDSEISVLTITLDPSEVHFLLTVLKASRTILTAIYEPSRIQCLAYPRRPSAQTPLLTSALL